MSAPWQRRQPWRKTKYNAKKIVNGGRKFDSKAEAARYSHLCQLQDFGKISDLQCQKRFKLFAHGVHICDYIADFRYLNANGEVVVEDVKGVETDVFKLKSKLFRAQFGFPITIIRK